MVTILSLKELIKIVSSFLLFWIGEERLCMSVAAVSVRMQEVPMLQCFEPNGARVKPELLKCS